MRRVRRDEVFVVAFDEFGAAEALPRGTQALARRGSCAALLCPDLHQLKTAQPEHVGDGIFSPRLLKVRYLPA